MFLKSIFKIRKCILFLCFILVFLLTLTKSISCFDDLNPSVIVRSENFNNKQSIDFYKRSKIVGEFKSNYNNLGIVSVKFNTHDRINTDFLQFRIKEKNNGDWFYAAKYKVDQFQNKKYFPFGFPEIIDSKNKIYEFEIISLEGIEGNIVSIDSGNNQFLVKNSFPKSYLLGNKKFIPTFIFYKVSSIFLNIDVVNYLLVFLESIILYLFLGVLNTIFLFLKKIKFPSIPNFLIIQKKDFVFKDHIFEYVFLLSSFIIFIFLLFNPQKFIYDAEGYYNLGYSIYLNHFDVIGTNLYFRTYAFPLLISFLIGLSNLFKLNLMYVIFSANYLFFVLSIFLIYKILVRKSVKVANIFLLINSFNIINLSFLNTVLTESFMILPIAILFYLFSFKKYSRLHIFLIGFISALMVMIRPSNLFLFLIVTIFVLFQIRKKIKYLFWYLIPILLIFSISFLNVYKQENKLSLFTTTTNGIYDGQVKSGVGSFKYETSVRSDLPAIIWYLNNQASELTSQSCKSASNCIFTYMKKNPIKYISILAIHTFTLFDRSYINTYVENIYKIDNLLVIYNYIVLSSVVCFFIFFIKSYIKRYRKILFLIIFLIFGTLSIYIPIGIESRFSAPIFPLMTIYSAFYFYSLFKENRINRIKIIGIQLLFILLFTIISYLVSQTIVLI